MRRKKDIYEEYREDSVEDIYQETESFNNEINAKVHQGKELLYEELFEEAYRRDQELLYTSLFKIIEDHEKVRLYEKLFKELDDRDKQALYEGLFEQLDKAERQALYDDLFNAIKEPQQIGHTEITHERESKKNQGKLIQFVKQNILLSVCLVIAAIVVFCAVFLLVKGKVNTDSDVLSKEYMNRIREKAVIECNIDYINNFFNIYYAALASGNTTLLEEMYDEPQKANINARVADIVDHYDNLKCYVTPGINDDEMVVFVYNELIFANISSAAPSVDCFYLKYDEESQHMKITSDMYTNQKKMKYMTLISYKEPIRTLIDETNSALFTALENNTDLRNLYVMMLSLTEEDADHDGNVLKDSTNNQ